MQQDPPRDSFIVSVAPAAAPPERTVGDIIIGSLGLVIVLASAAVVLGGAFAAVRYGWLRRHPPGDDHMPPVRPDGRLDP